MARRCWLPWSSIVGYNAGLLTHCNIMEAEQLNALASRLTDLAKRATELRGYL
jgi:hypothetical protein